MELLSRLIVSRSPRGWVGREQAHLSSGPLGFGEGSSTASLFLRSTPHTRGMVWGRRWEGGSGVGTYVHPWWIHVDVWQNQYSIVK